MTLPDNVGIELAYRDAQGGDAQGLVKLLCFSESDMAGEDCAGASPAALICSADPRQSWKDFPPKPSYPPAEQKSPPILTRSYCRDALHSETKDSRGRGGEARGEESLSPSPSSSHTHAYIFRFFTFLSSDRDKTIQMAIIVAEDEERHSNGGSKVRVRDTFWGMKHKLSLQAVVNHHRLVCRTETWKL